MPAQPICSQATVTRRKIDTTWTANDLYISWMSETMKTMMHSNHGQLMTTKWDKLELAHDSSVESSSEVVKKIFATSCKSTL